MEKQAFEQSGLIPRSIIRTFDRFRKQLFPGAENIILQEFRLSRYQVLVSVKSLITLIILPLILNFLLKNFIITPGIEYFWNTYQSDIFLNSYQEKRAVKEIENFENKLYFERLLEEENTSTTSFEVVSLLRIPNNSTLTETDILKQKLQQKTIQIAFEFNQQSIIGLTNIVADSVTCFATIILALTMKPQVIILKSFITESIYSLSDTTKSFLLIFVTDLLVGFHSPRGWDLALELFLKHFGFPETKEFVLIFVATFPVILDTVFKYWIFRYLNKISPSTVATYHNMIE